MKIGRRIAWTSAVALLLLTASKIGTAQERERGETEQRERRAAQTEQAQRERQAAALRQQLEQMEKQIRALREAGKLDEANAKLRELNQLREKAAGQRGGRRPVGEARREVPAEVRQKLAQLRARANELKQAGKPDQAAAIEREIEQLMARFQAQPRNRQAAGGDKLSHLRAALEHLQAAGQNELAEQVAKQIEQLQRESGAARQPQDRPREGEARERRERD